MGFNCLGLLKNVKSIDIAGALGDYDRAIELDPYLSEAFYNRGTLKHKELGEPVGALADYDSAVADATRTGDRDRSSSGICLSGAGFTQAELVRRWSGGGAGSRFPIGNATRTGDIDSPGERLRQRAEECVRIGVYPNLTDFGYLSISKTLP